MHYFKIIDKFLEKDLSEHVKSKNIIKSKVYKFLPLRKTNKCILDNATIWSKTSRWRFCENNCWLKNVNYFRHIIPKTLLELVILSTIRQFHKFKLDNLQRSSNYTIFNLLYLKQGTHLEIGNKDQGLLVGPGVWDQETWLWKDKELFIGTCRKYIKNINFFSFK